MKNVKPRAVRNRDRDLWPQYRVRSLRVQSTRSEVDTLPDVPTMSPSLPSLVVFSRPLPRGRFDRAISFFRLTYTLLWSTSKELQVFSAKSEVVPNFASVQSKMSPMFKDNITHLAERAAANELIIADMLSQMARLAAAPLEVDPRHFYNSPSAMRHKEREGCSTVQPWGRLQPQPHTYSSPAPPSSVCQRQPARPITEELLLTFRQEKGYAPRFRLTFDGKLYAMYPNNSHLYNQPVDPVPSKKSSTSLQRGSSASAGHSLGGSYQWPYWRHSLSEVVRYGPGNARFRVATALASLLRGVCSDPEGNFLHFAQRKFDGAKNCK